MNIGSFHDREHAWFSPTKRGRKALQSRGTAIKRKKKTKAAVYFARTLRSARPRRAARRQTDSGMPPMQCPAPKNSGIGKCMTSHTVDPITRSVVQHRLSSIVAEMGEAMLRTSYSQILNSSRDFSLAICDVTARLIAQADHIPVHVGALPWATRAVEERFKEVAPGDVILMNDPYHGGSHLPDLTVFVPIFDGSRRLFWSIVRAHQSDIGTNTVDRKSTRLNSSHQIISYAVFCLNK